MGNKKIGIDSAALHIIAMSIMLLDHMWGTILPSQKWMTVVGRIAFPIFAFMIVEGFFHTRNMKKYIIRLLICAVASEVPFDLMIGGIPFYPFQQNVIWTFLIAICGMLLIEKTKKTKKLWLIILVSVLVCIFGLLLGTITMVDYFGTGVLTVLIFYFLREKKWWCFAGQLIILYWLNVEFLGGECSIVYLFGRKFEIVQQGVAILALIPIWLYNGKKGYSAKWFQYFCYAFYPVHILILSTLMLL